MNETAAGMTQTMPIYLIGVGILLMVALVYLLIRMRKGKEERIDDNTTVSIEEAVEMKESAPETSTPSGAVSSEETGRQTTASESVAAKEVIGRVETPLTVNRDPFVETPNIGRESFDAFAGKRVLVVEDNPVNRKLILTLMGGSGIDLDSAEDGVEALEKLRAPDASYDLVLMDVNMPRMDGLECTRQIRSDERLKTIPVLALTASTTQEEVDAILESGMNGYLDKPINLGKLYSAFIQFMQEYRRPSAKAEATAVPEGGETDPGILDVRGGLEHTNEDPALYRMLLTDFLQEYGHSEERFKTLVKAKDFEALRALIIDLEGIAGTLGAVEFYRLVLEINQVLDRGATMLLSDYAEEYAGALSRLREEIDSYLDG